MNYYSVVFALILLLTLSSAAPQQQQSIVEHNKSEAMTAAAMNSGIQVATGFISIFQTMLNNFWTTLPTIVNLFASPAGANVPAVPGVGGGGGGGIGNNLPNPLNGQFGGPIRQMQSNTGQVSNEIIEIIDDNIESFANDVRVLEIRGASARG